MTRHERVLEVQNALAAFASGVVEASAYFLQGVPRHVGEIKSLEDVTRRLAEALVPADREQITGIQRPAPGPGIQPLLSLLDPD